jgi:RNAse (barnase) inhibitor barstar
MTTSYFCVFHPSDIHTISESGSQNIYLNGKEILSLNDFYKTLSTKLQFDANFGNNLDALYDNLSDLSWIDMLQVNIIIENTNYFLKNESVDTKSNVILTLYDAAESISSDPLFEDEPQRSLIFYFEHTQWLEDIMEENALIWQYI